MRQASLLGGLVGVLLLSGRLPAAEGPPDVRTVIAPRAQVWCGPSTSDGLYPTNELRQGERVQVVQEESEWLAIRPPAGSFSWINERFVKRMFPSYPATYVVTYSDHPAPVLVGSSLKRDRPTKMGVRLERGTQVRLVGRIMTDSEGTWLPIESPEGELRYIRKEDVSKRATVVASAASVRKTAVEPPPPPDGDVLWRDAEMAERKGRIADAIRLYRQAGDANLSVNPARAEAAYQRAHWLEQAGSNPSGGSHFAPDRGTPASLVPANQSGTNAVRLIGTTGSGPANGQLVSTQTVSPGGGTQPYNDYRRGRLQFAHKHDENGRYHLMDARGQPILMVVAGPGVDLSSHVDRNVELWGYSSYVPDLRKYLMTVTSVREAQ